MTAGTTAAGEVTITLHGKATKVALAEGDDSAEKAAAKVAAATYEGWEASRAGAVVTFTKETSGEGPAPAYNAGSTGAAGSIKVTTAGTADTWV